MDEQLHSAENHHCNDLSMQWTGPITFSRKVPTPWPFYLRLEGGGGGGGGGGGWHLSHHCLENTSDHPAPTDRTQKTVKSIREMILLLEYHLGNIARNLAVFPCSSHSNSLPSRTKIRAEILTFMMPVDLTIWQQNVHSMKHILMLPRVVCYPTKTIIQD